jgi:hypothetical protein
MALLDQPTLAQLANRADLADTGKYAPAYVAQVIDDAHGQIAGYLGFDPVLQVIAGEEGTVTYVQSGSYVGRYAFTLRGAPLVPGLAPSVFTYLQLTYGLAVLPNAAVDLNAVTLLHALGRAFTLAPGAVEALTWQYGLTPGVQAVGYVAWYAAGYATGINDPVPTGGGSGFAATATVTNGSITAVTITNGGSGYTSLPVLTLTGGGGNGAALLPVIAGGQVVGVTVLDGGRQYTSAPTIGISSAPSYNAPPMPAAITQAAVLLCRERIAMDDAANEAPTNTAAGAVASERTADQALAYRAPSVGKNAPTLGYGSPLAVAAAARLDPYRRVVLPVLI